MTDMIPAVKESYFPPRNRAERKPAFARTIAASFASDDDYVYSFTDDQMMRKTLVPLSLSEMLASPIDIIHEEAEAPHAADPQLANHAMTSFDQTAHRTDALPEHAVDQNV